MKKFIYLILIIMIILLAIFILKNIFNIEYSHNDIKDLINKGIYNMDNMNNVYLEKETNDSIAKYYYKGNKRKLIVESKHNYSTSSSNVITDLENNKNYIVDEKNKTIIISDKILKIQNGIQYDILNLERFNKDEFKYEFKYIKDEKIDNKDCIFIKEQVYNSITKKYTDHNYTLEHKVPVYWIEKSTGFVIGISTVDPGQDTAVPETIIKNISFGNVLDSNFELPKDYNIIEKNNV